MKKSKSKTVIHKMLVKAFGDLEIKDARKPLLLVPTEADFKSAVRKNPQHCGLSRCVGRMFGATLALFFKGFAYIDLIGEDGVRRIYRYSIGKTARDCLIKFDRGEALKFDRSISLRPPPPQNTLSGLRKRTKSWRLSDSGKAIIAEQRATSAMRIAERQAARAQDQYEEIRSEKSAAAPQLNLAQRQRDVSQRELRKAREKSIAATAKANELRACSFRTNNPPKPRHFDLTVRNASGFFSRVSASA